MIFKKPFPTGSLELKNLKDGKYRYLTTPSGNPNNFSYIEGMHNDTRFEIRQQVRIKSHLADDIAFTPDIAVIKINADIQGHKDPDYASGKRKFFFVNSSEVYSSPQSQDRIWVKLSFLLRAYVFYLAASVELLGKWPLSEGFLNKPVGGRPLAEKRVA